MANTYESAVGNLAAFSTKTREEYKEWEKRHAEMVNAPPTEGKQYLNHALNLIRLFEGLGELHPIAKAVVVTFKSVVLFEKDRKENNARVQSVLLAQTNMMNVFIELERLWRLADGEDEIPDVDTDALADLGRRIERDIKDCGNSFDTYYSERKLVKFLKSDEWKQRMNGYVQIFTEHKIHVQTLLAFQTQRGIHDINTKLAQLLNVLFNPADDEQKIVTVVSSLGHPRIWLKDDTRIERLLTLTNDTTFNRPTLSATGDPTTSGENEGRKQAIIQEVREELTTPLEDLCLRNLPYFEQKLDFHTEQLKEAISASAQTVIRALQGPYDRLNHEDLRELWKEMNWIFCIDNRQFLFALQEYYLDRYVKYQRNGPDGAEGNEVILAADAENRDQSRAQHTDAWTLFYLGRYSDRILNSIDKDNSGYIRISEANDFTATMPASWSLPQWCTYHAIGWLYEDRIYQQRIRKLLIKLCETQVNALPLNRKFMTRILDYLTSSYFLLSNRPSGVEQNPPVELVELVKSKVLEQDQRYRKSLGYFKKLGINASSIALVFRDKEVETYILLLITLLLEEYLQIFEVCSSEILDAREFLRILETTDVVMELVHSRIISLEAQLRSSGESTFQNALASFRGGMFASYYQNIFVDGGKVSEFLLLLSVSTHLQDESLLDGIPAEALYGHGPPVLHYTTWSEHVENSQGEINIEDEIPTCWDDKEDNTAHPEWIREPLPFPHFGLVSCDDCGRSPVAEMHNYTCVECFNTDFCSPCWHSGQTKTQGHFTNHTTVRMSLKVSFSLRLWMIALAEYQVSKLISDVVFHSLNNQTLVEAGEAGEEYAERYGADASLITQTALPCKSCGNPLDLKATTYMCIMHDCKDHVLCENCVDKELVDDTDTHKHWHNMVVVKDLLIVLRPNEEPQPLHTAAQPAETETESTNARIQKLEDRVVALETELRNANNDIKTMMLELLSKMNSITSGNGSRSIPTSITAPQAGSTGGYNTPSGSGELSEVLVVSGFGSSSVALPPDRGIPLSHPTTQGPPSAVYAGQDSSTMYHPPLHPAGASNYEEDYADDDEYEDQGAQLQGSYYAYNLQGPPPNSGSRYDDY